MTGQAPLHKVTSLVFQTAVIDMDGALTASECVHFRFYHTPTILYPSPRQTTNYQTVEASTRLLFSLVEASAFALFLY